jgi:hypothetical protein
MTPPEFRLCLDLLAWSQRGLARLLGLDDRTLRRWASGPGDIADWLATLAAFHAKHPPPLKAESAHGPRPERSGAPATEHERLQQ